MCISAHCSDPDLERRPVKYSNRHSTAHNSSKSEVQPASAQVLRQTQFMGKPLLASDPLMSMSAIGRPWNSPDVREFEAFHPNIGYVTARDGQRQELFLRLDKAAIFTKVYEKSEPPTAQDETTGHRAERSPTYQAFSKAAVTIPVFYAAADGLTRSGLFTTPPTSPRAGLQLSTTNVDLNPTGKAEKVTESVYLSSERPKPLYQAYRPPTSQESNTSRSFLGKSLRPILTTSVQDADYSIINVSTPDVSPRLCPRIRTGAPRRFSFDFDAPEDWEYIDAYSRTHSRSNSIGETAPCLKDRNFITDRAELFITESPQEIDEAPFCDVSPVTTDETESTSPSSGTTISPISPEAYMSSGPAPFPTTRYYASAIYQFGRFVSRRQTPYGTVKLPHHVINRSEDGKARFELEAA